MPLADPGIWNLTIYAGTTFTVRATPSGTPWDLTGYTARAKARTTYDNATALLDIDTTGGEITLGGAAGWVQIDLDATTTAALGVSVGHTRTQLVWDLELVNGADVTQFARGVLTIEPEATR